MPIPILSKECIRIHLAHLEPLSSSLIDLRFHRIACIQRHWHKAPMPLSSLSRYSLSATADHLNSIDWKDMFVTISVTPNRSAFPGSLIIPAASAAPASMEVRSKPVLLVICERILRERLLLQALECTRLTPLEIDKDQGDSDDSDGPGKGGQERPRLLGAQILEAQRRVPSEKDMDERSHVFMHAAVSMALRLPAHKRVRIRYGSLPSLQASPIRAGIQSCASSGLCVTITTRRSFATSFNSSMTCTLVLLNPGPRWAHRPARISGSLTSAPRDRDTLHLPAGHLARLLVQLLAQSDLFQRLCRPTSPLAAGRSRRSSVASSTFASTVWCGIRL